MSENAEENAHNRTDAEKKTVSTDSKSDIVNYILQHGFSSLTYEDQIKLKNSGRPLPKRSRL